MFNYDTEPMKIKIRIILFIVLVFPCSVFPQQQSAGNVKSTVRLAMAQMLVEAGNKQANLDRAVQRIEEAAGNGAHIILLPEAMDLGWTHSSALTEAGPVPGGSTFKKLARAAKRNKIYVCAGIIEKDGNNIYNSAVLINSKGELVLKHRKLNELDIAHSLYAQGDVVNVCETEFGTIGLLICADARAKDFMLTRTLGYLGADLILLPSSWAVEPAFDNTKTPYINSGWQDAFNAVCREFNLSIAAVSNVGIVTDGPWKDWKCIGNSLFVSENPEKFTVLPYGEKADTILYQNVRLLERPARGNSWYNYWGSMGKK